jgi:hypothetical protein
MVDKAKDQHRGKGATEQDEHKQWWQYEHRRPTWPSGPAPGPEDAETDCWGYHVSSRWLAKRRIG